MSRKKKKLNLAIKILIVFLLVVIVECCFQVFVKSHKNKSAEKAEIKNEVVEEKKEIIDYVLANDNNYKEAASKYNVPYYQVFNWVKKYKATGEISFQDKRGRPSSKSIKELTEVERLQIELEKQKRINERLELANEILKKNLQIKKQLQKDSRK